MRTVAIGGEGTLPAVRVPARFNGPPDSANGGYTCGLVAAELHGGGVEVTLRAPPPLETEMAVERDGDTVRMSDGETLVAEARSAAVDVGELPPAVTPEEAEEAVAAGLQRWTSGHPFPTCFVCGPRRLHGDGLDIFPVEHERGRFVATWTPEEPGDGLGGPRLPDLRTRDEPGQGPADRARATGRGDRRGAEAGRAPRARCRGSSAATGASARPPACCSTRTAGRSPRSRALWIELRQE